MKRLFVPHKVTITRGTLPTTGEEITLTDLSRGSVLQTNPITSSWGRESQVEGFDYTLNVTAKRASANFTTSNAFLDLKEWAEEQYPVFAVIESLSGEKLYWYEVVTMSSFRIVESGELLAASFSLTVRSRRPRIAFDETSAKRSDTGFLPIVRFGNDSFFINSLSVRSRERSSIFEYVDGTIEKVFYGLHLEFELRAEAFERIDALTKTDLLDNLREGSVSFRPIPEVDSGVSYNVVMPDPPRTVYGYDRGIEDRSMSLILLTRNRLSSYPSWMNTDRQKIITNVEDHGIE